MPPLVIDRLWIGMDSLILIRGSSTPTTRTSTSLGMMYFALNAEISPKVRGAIVRKKMSRREEKESFQNNTEDIKEKHLSMFIFKER